MKVLIHFIVKIVFLVLVVSVGIYSWEKWLRKEFFDLLGIDKLNLKNNKSEIIKESPDKAFEKQSKALMEENKQIKDELLNLKIEIKNKDKEISKLENNNKILETEKRELLEENISLGERLSKVEIEEEVSKKITSEESSDTATNDTNILYANSIYDNQFSRVTVEPDENTVFIIYKGENGIALFDILPRAERRILANSSFLDGCDKQVFPDAQRVLTNNQGEAKLQADGKWRVIKKLSVTVS